MLYPSLLAVHVFCAIFWGGGGVIGGFFLLSVVSRTLEGPDPGAKVQAALAQRRFGKVLGAFAALTLLSGAAMMGLRAHESPAWFLTGDGMVLSLAALIGVGAFVIAAAVLRPRTERVLALAQGGTASSDALRAEQAKLARSARVASWHLLVAALLMASHGVVALVLAR